MRESERKEGRKEAKRREEKTRGEIGLEKKLKKWQKGEGELQ